MSDIPQGLLSIISVGDMGSGIECILNTFASDISLCGVVDILEGRDAIQRVLERWACKPHKVQQGQVHGPASGSGQSQTLIQPE